MSFLQRFEPLAGTKNLKKIQNAKIAIFGLGGVGSYTAEALARSGAENLVLIDGDIIEESNINRQLYALHSTLGNPKTEIAKKRILDINPNCKVFTFSNFILPDNFEKTLGKDFFKDVNFIVDAVDTITLKIFLAKICNEKNIPIISAMGCGNRLNADFEFADIYKTSVCPLCKVMRTKLKAVNVKRLKVLYSKSPCAVKRNPPASASWVPSVAGLLIAGEVIKSVMEI
ncbi:tRNA threonylcarbamoyladenosine dehydratase [Treponema pedis]|uniref:tRNA threonylcarbamoyladenosine dehydratase n=1 Tax=Treponema pedis TaxID=409322 RepID=A0A7S6WQ18_9SPIR|nr:tRNA threonylcarbamoyladenosine dehydratase [Treponema pedis]QOW60999.1 tRNA threonylcarbamoyladenosine dehydratase [Treponema pedis]